MEGEYEVTIRLTIKKVAPGKRDKVSPKKQEPVGKVAEKEVENKKKKERVVDRIIQRVVETSTPYNTWVKTPQSTNIAGYFYFQGSRKLSIEFKGEKCTPTTMFLRMFLRSSGGHSLLGELLMALSVKGTAILLGSLH